MTVEILNHHLRELKDALEFYDKVLDSSEIERIAVGHDHHDRLEKAVRNVVADLPSAYAEGRRHALAMDQLSLFAEDAGKHVAAGMREAATFLYCFSGDL